MISSWVMWKSDFHMAHVEIRFLFTSATGDFTNFMKMYGNFSMTITYTNSYRNRNLFPRKSPKGNLTNRGN